MKDALATIQKLQRANAALRAAVEPAESGTRPWPRALYASVYLPLCFFGLAIGLAVSVKAC
jgi:hypothetical protein